MKTRSWRILAALLVLAGLAVFVPFLEQYEPPGAPPRPVFAEPAAWEVTGQFGIDGAYPSPCLMTRAVADAEGIVQWFLAAQRRVYRRAPLAPLPGEPEAGAAGVRLSAG